MPRVNAETWLGFDVGLKKTGVAVMSSTNAYATPLVTIKGNQGQLEWPLIERLLEEWQPKLCVIGDPRTDNPHLNKLIRRLAHYLQTRKVDVAYQDETLTSSAANTELSEAGFKSKQKQQIRDQYAAKLILESYARCQPKSS